MTDAEFMLAVLQERPNQWVPQMEIVQRSQAERGCGLTCHSRAPDLRDRGYKVENQIVRGWDGYHQKYVGRPVSYYRLVTLEAADPLSPEEAHGSAASSVGEPHAPASPRTGANGSASPQPVAEASPALFDLPESPAWA